VPAGGSATIRNTASPAVTATAPSSSRAEIRRLSSNAPIGNANTRLVARIGWTTTSRPAARARAWQMKPPPSLAIPASQTGRRARRRRNPGLAASLSEADDATRCCRTVLSAKNSAAATARGISIVTIVGTQRAFFRPLGGSSSRGPERMDTVSKRVGGSRPIRLAGARRPVLCPRRAAAGSAARGARRCPVGDQRSYEMPARPRALRSAFRDARVWLWGANDSATFIAE
jgi:hypothetical protein